MDQFDLNFSKIGFLIFNLLFISVYIAIFLIYTNIIINILILLLVAHEQKKIFKSYILLNSKFAITNFIFIAKNHIWVRFYNGQEKAMIIRYSSRFPYGILLCLNNKQKIIIFRDSLENSTYRVLAAKINYLSVDRMKVNK